jgi:aspartyl-tRNA(Asn)/glutamyl-tRNA(Gln) amidotransferase subunit C
MLPFTAALLFEEAMSLTPDDVRKIALLSRLELSDDELAVLGPQLDAIVGYVAQLSEAPTDGVEPLAHALPVQNVFRDDEPGESLPVEQALANAPAKRGAFFQVPAVLEE